MCMPVIKKYYTGLRIATQKTISEMISLINNVSSFSLPNVSQIKIPAVGVEKGQKAKRLKYRKGDGERRPLEAQVAGP